MTPGRRAACGPRSVGVALACAGWLVVAPPLLAEDAAVPDDEPGPVILVRPADGAAVPGGKGGSGGGGPGGGGSGGTLLENALGTGQGNATVALAWRPARSGPLSYFVEVLALGPDEPREVFTGYTRQSDLRLHLDAGQYVWRVLAVSRVQARYSVSPWWSFSTDGAPEGGR